jgi:hypothetical protein
MYLAPGEINILPTAERIRGGTKLNQGGINFRASRVLQKPPIPIHCVGTWAHVRSSRFKLVSGEDLVR